MVSCCEDVLALGAAKSCEKTANALLVGERVVEVGEDLGDRPRRSRPADGDAGEDFDPLAAGLPDGDDPCSTTPTPPPNDGETASNVLPNATCRTLSVRDKAGPPGAGLPEETPNARLPTNLSGEPPAEEPPAAPIARKIGRSLRPRIATGSR